VPRFLSRIPAASRAFLLAGLGLSACASSSASKAASAPVATRPLRVHFVDWRSGQSLTLVDQSHTDRTTLYSTAQPLKEANTKVTTDEVMEETIKFFRERKFFEKAAKGAALGAANSGAAQSLEVETPDEIVHMDLGRLTSAADAKVFRECRDNFAALYNNVYQLQTVDHPPDWDAQQKSLQLKPPPKKDS
jgi:hypothetical protein